MLLISQHAFALTVKQVRFGNHTEKMRMVLDLSAVADFRVFTLANPYRIILDLPDFTWQAGKVIRPPEYGIEDIRQGPLQPGVSRVVFDMNNPVEIKSAFLLPKDSNKADRIVIDFQNVTQEQFEKSKNKIHGPLSIDNTLASNLISPKVGKETTTNIPREGSNKKPTIIIDPGHGGADPGALGPGKLYEKQVVLELAKELKRQLLATGRYKVEMTREKDIFIKLADRVKFARKHDGDLFVSIHADSISKTDVHGTSLYTLSKEASDAQTAKLAESENKADLIAGMDLSIEDEQVANILVDFAMTDTMNQSKFFANTLVTKMRSNGVNLLENPHRYAGFAVLKAPDIPSLLIEAGFMSNEREAKLLNQSQHRKKIAFSIMMGINAYFAHVDKNEKS